MRRLLVASVTLGLAAWGCQKTEEPELEPAEATEEETAPAEVEETESPAQAAEPSTTTPSAEALPIPEDFAEQAAADVTPDNYEQQLRAMAQELEE